MCKCDQDQTEAAMKPTANPGISRSMEDALCLAMMTGLLSTFVQSLMSHMANSSANQQSSVAAGSHSAITGLATVAKAVDQILGDDQAPGSGTPRPAPQAVAPMMAQATQYPFPPQQLAVT